MPKDGRSSRPAQAGLIGGAAVLATLGGVALWLIMLSGPVNLGLGLLEGRDHLQRAQKDLSDGRFKASTAETFAAQAASERARSGLEAAGPVMDLATLAPSVARARPELDHVVGALEHSADAAGGTLEIGLNALRGPDRVIAPDAGNGSGSVVRLDRLEDMAETLQEVRVDLDEARRELDAIDPKNLPRRLRPDIADARAEAERTDRLLVKAETGFELLPGILGADGPRTYMLGFQNSAELRGSGGAMLQFEFLTIDEGRPELVGGNRNDAVGSIYKIDRDRTPIDIPLPDDAWYVANIEDAQRFGNSNWSPDWPLDAELAIDYGRASPGPFPEVDGVVAVDPVMVSKLMPGIGPFTHGPYRISSRRVVDVLLSKAYGYFPIPNHRRDYLGRLVSKFFSRMFDPARPTELIQGVGESLAGKHMQIWMADPREQAFVEQMEWDGAITPSGDSDYLAFVEQNVGGNKLDYTATQTDDVDIALSNEDAQISAAVTIENGIQLPEPRWVLGDSKSAHRPMMNVYVGREAELDSAEAGPTCPIPLDRSCLGRIDTPPSVATWTEDAPPTHFEKGKQVWSATLQIPPGRRGTLRVGYRVPGIVRTEDGRKVYRLVVQRQPKVGSEVLAVTIRVPEGARDIRAPGFTSEDGALTYERPLKADTELEVSWRS